jgi:RNA polymerase sigma-70 factor (ECF subfamily)
LARVYADHVQYVWRALRYLGVAEADLADVCHDVFLVVQRRLPSFEGRSSLRTWIYGICLRTTSDYRARAFRRREVPHGVVPDSIVVPTQPRAETERRLRARLVELLGELRPEQREVFVLYEVEELDMAEVAAAVGCPLQTAYSRLHAARRVLRERLGAEGITPDALAGGTLS